MHKKLFTRRIKRYYIGAFLLGIIIVIAMPQTVSEEDRPEIGFEYLEEGRILHMWNTKDSYYYNTSDGIQFSNWFNQSKWYTRNIFCGGVKNQFGDRIDCNLFGNFTWVATTDNLTFANYTGTRVFDLFAGRELILILNYHLKVNDSNLTIQPKLRKNMPMVVLGTIVFQWRMERIQIGGDVENDVLKINNITDHTHDTYDLHDNLDLVYRNSSFILLDDTVNRESLAMWWDQEITESVTIRKEAEYNSKINVTVDMGEFIDDEISAEFHWIDVDLCIFICDPGCTFNNFLLAFKNPDGSEAINRDIMIGDFINATCQPDVTCILGGDCAYSAGCLINWQDNTSGSFTRIPEQDVDIDCTGQNCTLKSKFESNIVYGRPVRCEADYIMPSIRCQSPGDPQILSPEIPITCLPDNSITFGNGGMSLGNGGICL